jgi:hypothetical protein
VLTVYRIKHAEIGPLMAQAGCWCWPPRPDAFFCLFQAVADHIMAKSPKALHGVRDKMKSCAPEADGGRAFSKHQVLRASLSSPLNRTELACSLLYSESDLMCRFMRLVYVCLYVCTGRDYHFRLWDPSAFGYRLVTSAAEDPYGKEWWDFASSFNESDPNSLLFAKSQRPLLPST